MHNILDKIMREVRHFIYKRTHWRPKPGSIFFSPSAALRDSLRKAFKDNWQ